MADEAVSEAAVQAALDAVAPFWREAHAVLQAYPSAALARAMLEGAAPLIAGERAERAEAMLAAVREHAETWAALAPADDWGLTPTDTVAADCGRAILAIIKGEDGHGSE